MNKNVRKHLFNVLFVLALLGLTVYLLLKSNEELSWADVNAFFSGCNPWYIVAAAACMLIFLIAEGCSIKNIAGRLGYKVKYVSSFAYSSADAYYSALTPSATGGQPASAFYMVRDGIDAGSTTFILVFNLLGYTAAIFVLGVAAFLLSAFTSQGGWIFFEFSTFSKIFILFGVATQAFLIWLFIACLRRPGAVLKTGNALISFLKKIKLSKKPDALREKLSAMVEKYRNCGGEIKKHRGLFVQTLLWNVLQRGAQVAITAFVCKAAAPQTDMLHVFALQCFVLLGYNSIPLPGGSGIFELLYMNVFASEFPSAFLVVAVMVTRVISYYACLIVSGVYTLIYHVARGGAKEKYAQVIEEIVSIKQPYSAEFERSVEEAATRAEEKRETEEGIVRCEKNEGAGVCGSGISGAAKDANIKTHEITTQQENAAQTSSAEDSDGR